MPVKDFEIPDIVEEINSMWLNPVVLTRKKPGSPHFYLHPRHVNDLSGPDGFEPPVLNNVIRSLQ